MTNKIQSAFQSIHAEEPLKAATLQHLSEVIQRKEEKKTVYRHSFRRWSPALAACLVFVLFTGIFSYNLYFTSAAYIDLDINPSLALTVNRFDYVIDVEAYNDDASLLLSGLSLRHEKADEAMDKLIAAAAETGVLQQSPLVSVTVQSVSGDDSQLLVEMQTCAEASVAHYSTAEVDVFPVDGATRDAAHEHHISPAKYLAILELQEVDPTATIDRCSGHTIGELKEMSGGCGDGHHGCHH